MIPAILVSEFMQRIIQNLAVRYDDEGSGPLIVMLHGWGTSGADFAELAGTLAAEYRVIRVDFPGFGGSEQPSEDWHVSEYTQFVAALLDKLDIRQPHALIGHSFGGRVALKGLATGVLSADKLILVGAAGVKRADSARNTTLRVVAKTGKALLSLPGLRRVSGSARGRLYRSIGSQDYLQSGTMRQIFLNTINEDLSGYADRITQPTLLIWGSEDDQAPLADGKFFHEHIRGSRLKIAASAGHFVHHDEPIQVARWVREFLDE